MIPTTPVGSNYLANSKDFLIISVYSAAFSLPYFP
jgi:hypothetical protein